MKYIFIIALIIITGCGKQQTPQELYTEFVEKEKNKVPYKEHIKYFSTEKVKEIENQFPNYMKSMKKSKTEVIDFYLTFSQKVAQCNSLNLISENTTTNKSTLLYKVKDTCNNPETFSERTVTLTKQGNDWKITDVITKL